jgi:hypothetical protein
MASADGRNLSLGAFPNPLGTLANALAPALTSLVNVGYTDVVRIPTVRTSGHSIRQAIPPP